MRRREESVILDLMQTLGYSIDRYIGELSRRGYAPKTTIRYRTILNELADTLPREWALEDITPDQTREFLDRRAHLSKATQAMYVSVLRGFFTYAHQEGLVKHNPMDRIRRPKRPRAEDVDVITISTADVRRMIQACRSWREHICVNLLVYLGPRRGAAAQLRLQDVDFDASTIRFVEKGAKTIHKPMPTQLASLLAHAQEDGVWDSRTDYLIPNLGWPTRNAVRDDRIVYRIVKTVAERAGVRAHVHALRAAFAVYYLETHERDIEALKELLGHARYETTGIYLRRLDKAQSMERVRDLDWSVATTESLEGVDERSSPGSSSDAPGAFTRIAPAPSEVRILTLNQPGAFADNAAVPPAGFEPALPANRVLEPDVGSARDSRLMGFDLMRSLKRVLETA